MSALSWNQAICEPCWAARHPEGRVPARIADSERADETCAYCGDATAAGIFVRDDPANVNFPQPKDDS